MVTRTITSIALILLLCSGTVLGDEKAGGSKNSVDVIFARRVLAHEKKILQLQLTEEWVTKGHFAHQILELRKTQLWPGIPGETPEASVIWRRVTPYAEDSKRFSVHRYDVAVDSKNGQVYLAMGSMQFQIFSFSIDSKPYENRDGTAAYEPSAKRSWIENVQSFDRSFMVIHPVKYEYIDRIMEIDLLQDDDKLIMIAKVIDKSEEKRRFVWSIPEKRWLETAWTRTHGPAEGPTETLPGPVFDHPGGSSNTESGDGTGTESELGKIEKQDIQSEPSD